MNTQTNLREVVVAESAKLAEDVDAKFFIEQTDPVPSQEQNAEIERLKKREARLLSALKELFEKAPSYHDCIDAGLPICEWCIAENLIKEIEDER